MDNILGQLSSGKKQLKPTTTKDSSGLNKGREQKQLAEKRALQAVTGIQNEEDRRRYFFEASLDGWYDKLKDYTFASSFIPLEAEEAETIQKLYFGEPADATRLKPLEKRLDDCIKSKHDGSAFIKLSTRSPKDSKSIFQRATQAYKDMDKTGMTENDKWIALQEHVRMACKVTSGAEAIAILLDSRRVAEDLKYATYAETGKEESADKVKDRIDVSIVVRSFVADVTSKTEFRGFVWNQKFTCVGQYYHQLVFPEVIENQQVIAKDLQDFFEKVKPHVPVPCYMMDLVWFGDGREPMIVEINPFDGEGLGAFPASTGLFNWEKDRAVMKGEKPFELRVRKELPTAAEMANVSPEWTAVIRSA